MSSPHFQDPENSKQYRGRLETFADLLTFSRRIGVARSFPYIQQLGGAGWPGGLGNGGEKEQQRIWMMDMIFYDMISSYHVMSYHVISYDAI
jgi:hypothetical protein